MTQKGTILRCNQRNLLKRNEPFEKDCAIDYDDIVIKDSNKTQTVPLHQRFQKNQFYQNKLKSLLELKFIEQDQDVKLSLQANLTYGVYIMNIFLLHNGLPFLKGEML